MKIRIVPDLPKEVQALCQQILRLEKPFINVVISGGSLLPLINGHLNSPRVRIFFADERCVSVADPASNYGSFIRSCTEELLCTVLCPFESEESTNSTGSEALKRAAAAYEQKIRQFFPEGKVQFDLVLLGIGPDGHTASLFPNDENAASQDDSVLVVATGSAPKAPAERISLSRACISQQLEGRIVFVAGGREKNAILRQVLGRGGELVEERSEVPFSLFARRAVFILDEQSGAGLSERK